MSTMESFGEEEMMHSEELNESVELLNEVYSLKELIVVILDYYSFKNNLVNDEDAPGDEWKKGTKYDQNLIVPAKIDKLIEASFEAQLKKFTK